jgi:hypothetical protein
MFVGIGQYVIAHIRSGPGSSLQRESFQVRPLSAEGYSAASGLHLGEE